MNNKTIISSDKSKVKVYVIHTNEEFMIAKMVYYILECLADKQSYNSGHSIGIAELLFCIAVLLFGKFYLLLDIGALQTLAFIAIVFGHQASLYAIRSRKWLWSAPHPSHWVVFSSIADILIASALAVFGLLMVPISLLLVVQVFAVAIVYGFLVVTVKFPVFRYLKISQ